ncbi:MAG TPA: HAMP domain-containing sensor histidine kinase [Myxococcales bacterium]|jgi:signal transduction histidine kinase
MDPSGQRARSVVVLVVLTIAVPSLLLTGFAALAVSNEASAAKSRLEAQYKPVLQKAAEKFNGTLDQLIKEAPELFAKMRNVGRADYDEVARPASQLDFSKAAAAPFAVNPFVVDSEGEVLLPLVPPDATEAVKALNPEQRRTLESELAQEREPARYTLKDGVTIELDWALPLQRCDSLGAAHAEDVLDCDERDAALTKRLKDLRALASKRATDPVPFIEAAEALSRDLSSPTFTASPLYIEYVARIVAGRLKTLPESPRVNAVRRKLMYLAERPALLDHLSHLSHAKEGPPTIHAFFVNGFHRVVLAQPIDGALVGYELVPSSFDALVTEATSQAGPPLPTETLIWPVLCPPFWSDKDWMKEEDKVAAYALLKRTDLAWELIFVPTTTDTSLLTLQGNRTRLFLWSLLLIVGALVAGIAYTVRSIVKEARQSRLKVDFVSSVSHDLRTPLTSIRMFTETLLLGRVRDEKESKECLQVIAQETERLSRLTQRILDFSRMEAGRKAYSPKPEPVLDVIQQALAACRPVIEQAGFQVEVVVAPDVTTVVADRDALIEVLINLVTNAIKYSPEDKRLRISAKRSGAFIELGVEDHGIGIPKSEQARIFEKFYRVDCRRTTEVGGCGIGLSLVDHIVRAHGGKVEVQSEPGRGSTFTVRLPETASKA